MERPKRGPSAFDDIERLDQLGEVGKRPRQPAPETFGRLLHAEAVDVGPLFAETGTAVMQTRSRKVEMPSGLSLPLAFGMAGAD